LKDYEQTKAGKGKEPKGNVFIEITKKNLKQPKNLN
jgi:hypothetical protein